MWGALFKKQLMEVNAWLIQDKKKGKNRSGLGMAVLLLAYLVLFSCLGFLFYMMGGGLCQPLVTAELGWLYFAIMGLLSILLGVFGSVFNTYATLYMAKDNEFLLSMPIPPARILVVRLFGVWLWSLIYEAIVFVPGLIVYWQCLGSASPAGGLPPLVILSGVLLLLLLSVFVLTLSSILGWVVAKISGKLKNKSIVTVAASLAFLALYYYGYSKAYTVLQSILANAQTIGGKAERRGLSRLLDGPCGRGRRTFPGAAGPADRRDLCPGVLGDGPQLPQNGHHQRQPDKEKGQSIRRESQKRPGRAAFQGV